MKYREISSDLFTTNRNKLTALLDQDSFAILHSADVPWRSADGTTRFIQNSDFFYFTGVDQEESILILAPHHPDPNWREVLFVRETSELISIWEGHKLTQEQASSVSGIGTVYWTSEFDSVLRRLARHFGSIYLNHNEHPRSSAPLNVDRDDRFRMQCQDLFPKHHYKRLAPMTHSLRQEKSDLEIDLLKHACDITEKGFRRLLNFIKPGVLEYEIEAELLHEFVRHGSRGFAYEPIVASGRNNCVLHYLSNDQPCQEGDLVLLDVAAEYANYNADLTRTLPVNGRFTKRQRAVYEAVLRVFRICIEELIIPGKKIREEFHREVARIMEDELVALDLLDAETVASERADEKLPEEKRAYRKYFMHGVSHSLGLDVHDVNTTDNVFVENMCVTVEPGIYIPEEGFGIRLENDIIVRTSGNLDLMADIPIDPEEIEDLMAQGSS
ncbi:MAG: aminopeptidase P N-terminal domain-containing protein [Verrucomicrobiota bacterium]